MVTHWTHNDHCYLSSGTWLRLFVYAVQIGSKWGGLRTPATSETEHFVAMANNFSCNSRIRQITVRAFVCAWKIGGRTKLCSGLPLFSCTENWGDLRRNYKHFWGDLSKSCTKFEKNWGDFTHVCSSQSYFYWHNEQ